MIGIEEHGQEPEVPVIVKEVFRFKCPRFYTLICTTANPEVLFVAENPKVCVASFPNLYVQSPLIRLILSTNTTN